MGNTNSTLEDIWSAFNNPSGISNQNQPASVFSVRNQYGLSALTSIGAGLIVPLKTGVASISAFRFGDDLFHRQYVSLTYGNQFGIGRLGFRVNYFETFIEGFGNKTKITFDFGGIVNLSEYLFIGAYIRNIGRTRLSDFEDERIPTVLNLGISYRTLDKLIVNIDIDKDIEFDPRVKLGIEYQALKKFAVRSGINTSPFNNFFGLGFKSWRVIIDYAANLDYVLGLTHQLSLTYKLSI
ncbi:MAG: hypothetical protein AAF693_13335 [Bacteroidota bacterium]